MKHVQNVGTIERVLRMLVGAVLAVVGVLLLVTYGTLQWSLIGLAVIALGVDFVVTGIRGYCPLYRLLGWSTARRPESR